MLLCHLNNGVKLLETIWAIVDGNCPVANKLEPGAIYGNCIDIWIDQVSDTDYIARNGLAIECPQANNFDADGRDVAERVPDVLVRIQGGQPVSIRTGVLEVAARRHTW